MEQRQHELVIETAGKGFTDLTGRLAAWLGEIAAGDGLLIVFVRHTSASLVIQENADPAVLEDLERALARIAPEDERLYRHRQEGADDMPAHIRSALTHSQLAIPVLAGAMVLGTWQAVYLWEHRHRPHRRRLHLQFLGEIEA